MNIFFLDQSPQKAAEYMHNVHVNKMIVESCQLLANRFTTQALSDIGCPRTQKGNIRKHSYMHHPCTTWVLSRVDNFNWLREHTYYLCREFRIRAGKKHFCEDFLVWTFCLKTHNRKDYTTPALAMPDEYVTTNPVLSYRLYYINEKRFDKNGKWVYNWTGQRRPWWIPERFFDENYTGKISVSELQNFIGENQTLTT